MNPSNPFEIDSFSTSVGDLAITCLGHASVLLYHNQKNIYIDPYGEVADYSKLPKADLVLVTHEHFDHMDLQAIKAVHSPTTQMVLNPEGSKQFKSGISMRNGDVRTINGILVEAIPAYNLIHMREDGKPFHPRGVGNGYVLAFGDTRIYFAGDSENTSEMKALKGIEIAFLPMNLPYTMTPEMVADAAKAFRPHILYPYHFGKTDTRKLVELLRDEKDIEIRIRKMA
jgi:L-ascorbate metabolism protein UlaG (beta-lactamase superfamily)